MLKELVPSLNWLLVIQELDHPDFVIKDPKGLQFIVITYLEAAGSTAFPIQHIYKPWKNAAGQVMVLEISCSYY